MASSSPRARNNSWVTGSGAKVSSRQEVVLAYMDTHVNDKTIRVPFAVLDTLPDDVEDIILGNKFLLQAHYITFNPALADIVDLNYSNKPSSPTLMQMKGGPPHFAGLGQHSQARRSNDMLKLLSFSFPRPLVMIDSTRTKLSPSLERSSKHRWGQSTFCPHRRVIDPQPLECYRSPEMLASVCLDLIIGLGTLYVSSIFGVYLQY